MTQDEALKSAAEKLIAAFPDYYGSVVFNLQGKRKTVHCNVNSQLVAECDDGNIVEIDMKESKKL